LETIRKGAKIPLHFAAKWVFSRASIESLPTKEGCPSAARCEFCADFLAGRLAFQRSARKSARID
jgi:hypothetical protein